MSTLRRDILARVALLASLTLFVSSPALAQMSTDDAAGLLERSERSLDDIEARYLNPELAATNLPIATRFSDAKVAHTIGDYEKASILMLDVVTRTDRSYAPRREALFILADSLYQLRNFIGARGYLRELVDQGTGEYYQESLERLLEIAYETRNYEGVDALYAKLDGSRAVSAPVDYLRGKTLFSQGDYAAARASFERAAQERSLFSQATYYIGVCHVSEGNLDAARAAFVELETPKGNSFDDDRIASLASMAIGRLAYEKGDYNEAIRYYNKIPRNDPAFSDAAYEATWALVQLDELDAARRNVEVILFSEPTPERYTEAMLLRATLSVREKDYDTALASFRDVLDRYDPVREQFDAFAAKHGDLSVFFAGVVNEDLELRLPPGLPSIRTDYAEKTPREWLTEGGRMERALTMTGDLATTRDSIEEALAQLEQIEARLNSNARADAFPVIREGLSRSTSIESQLLSVRAALLARQEALTLPSLSGADASSYAQRKAAREALAARVDAIPKNASELDARGKAADENFTMMRRRLDELAYIIEDLRRELEAIESLQRAEGQNLSPADLAKVESLKAEVSAELDALERERVELSRDIELARQQVGGGDTIATSEREIRLAYRRALADDAAFLSRFGSSAELTRIARIRDRIPPAEARVDGFNDKMYGLVDGKLTDLRDRIAVERKLLTDHRASLDEVTGSSRRVVGEVAFGNFLRQRSELDRVLLQADVGTMNVLFTKKEQVTGEINVLFQERTEELKALQESFDDVR